MAQEAHGQTQAQKETQAHTVAAPQDGALDRRLDWGNTTSMDGPPGSIVAKRLVRNLRYRLTYIKVFESFLQPEPSPEVVRLLRALVGAQQTAVAPLSGYLKRLGVATQGLPLYQRLVDHASARSDVRSRLRFIHYGLSKAVSWYKAQLMDRQMTVDPELRRLLFELGESEAASLWHTEAAMGMLGIRLEPVVKDKPSASRTEPATQGDWRSPQTGASGRATWSREQASTWSRRRS